MATYLTEDGHRVQTGDRVYNYYDMQPGIIREDRGSGWFTFEPRVPDGVWHTSTRC
jgi:hypothetical protein